MANKSTMKDVFLKESLITKHFFHTKQLFKRLLLIILCLVLVVIIILTVGYPIAGNRITSPPLPVESTQSPLAYFPKHEERTLIEVESLSAVEDVKDVGLRLRNRAKQIKRLCKSNSAKITAEYQFLENSRIYAKHYSNQKRFIMERDTGLAICIQAKGGSSFWKHFFTHLGHRGHHIVYSPKSTSAGLGYISLKDFLSKPSKVMSQIQPYVFVRNPWDRLVSLYRQKVEFKQPIDPSRRYVRGACLGRRIESFEDLVDCVLWSYEEGFPDRHWEPATTRCGLCNVPYRFYGRLDKMNEEAIYMLESWKMNADVPELIETVRNMSMREVEHITQESHVDYNTYYNNIPEEKIIALQKMYELDIMFFGFPVHPQVNQTNTGV